MISIVEWLVEHPVVWFVITTVLLIGMYWAYAQLRGLRAAEQLIATQCDQATQQDISDFYDHAKDLGQEKQFLSELVKIRSAYGHNAVKIGHLIFVMQKLEGQIPSDKPAPAFNPTK